ncbi:MAG: hypothetical protein ACTHU0_10335 [Kofleriaceae bacterium]
MIASPHNDQACLEPATRQVIAEVESRSPALVDIAERFDNTDDLATWFRSLPQRDDEGLPCDGPKVTECRPPQRLRFDAADPNCFERAARWMGAAELIDPDRIYRLATVSTENGLHTFPTRDDIPVILDPAQSRNALRAGLWHATRNAGPVALTPSQAVDWLAELAMEPAARFRDGARRVQNGHRAMLGVLVLRPICVADVRDVAFLLALAEREARRFGSPGLRIIHSTAHAIDALDRIAADRWLDAQRAEEVSTTARNAGPFELRIGGVKLSPNIPLLGSLARIGGRIAGNVGLEALKVKLATLGVGAPVLSSIERELNREGLSLGPIATPPPMLGSLGAMTPEALAGRWIAQKL